MTADIGAVTKPPRSSRAGLLPFALLVAGMSTAGAAPAEPPLTDVGRALFFDVNLSRNRTQSCATCHDPAYAFTDPRDNGVAGAASLGDDGRSLGDRNAPSLSYARVAPEFHRGADGHYRGGFFLDGRAASLAAQAPQPMVNPLEMALADPAAVRTRIFENPYYSATLAQYLGAPVMTEPARLFAALGTVISAFERSDFFAPFDSKYDRSLRGEYVMSPLEAIGRDLFFSPMTNCANCHLAENPDPKAGETFTNYRYHNIGLPVNTALREKNGLGPVYRDEGLLAQPDLHDPALAGKYKVPSLRNVAVTGPYMHNGVFRELRTAILFYNKYTVSNKQSRTNPETGLPWGDPEVAATIDLDLLTQGQPIDENRLKALIAFLETLTDRRFEPLLVNATGRR